MKNRKYILEHEIKRVLNTMKSGAPSSRMINTYIAQKLPYDLMQIHRLTPHLTNITPNTIYQLVDYWQRMGNSTRTIARKVMVLRKIMNHRADIPTNVELGLSSHLMKKSITVADVDIHHFESTVVRTLCELQRHFGLKKSEALKFKLATVNQRLYIPRSIAYNNKDRFVAIETLSQQSLLQQLSKHGDLKIPPALSSWHQLELAQHGITDPENYRYLYMQDRYQHLAQQPGAEKSEIVKRLREELGYQSNQSLLKILKCLNVF